MNRRVALSWLVVAACGRFGFDPRPADAVASGADTARDSAAMGCAAQILANSDTACARTVAGALWCWGANTNYEIGDGVATDSPTPSQTQLPVAVVDAALGSAHGCALDSAHGVWCWGTNQNGAVGDGTAGTMRPTPVAATSVPSGVYQRLDAGAHFTCGVDAAGQAWCWGIDTGQQLGDNGTVDSLVPVQAMGATSVVELQSASYTTCAREVSGAVVCWARNDFGQFGNGSTAPSGVAIASAFPPATSMSTGGSLTAIPTAGHTCAVDGAGGAVRCAGANSYGELGDGTTAASSTPVLTSLANATTVAAGTWHTCAITSTAHVACWGRNDSGELGRGATSPYETDAQDIVGLTGVMSLAVGRDQSCALRSDRTIACWGANDRGQIGNGAATPALSPTTIEVPCP